MSNRKKKGSQDLYATDRVAVNLYSNIVSDFQRSEGKSFYAESVRELHTDISAFRSREAKEVGYISVGRFKRTKQVESILKKYRFKKDNFTDDELLQRTLDGYLERQLRIAQPMPLRPTGLKVLQRARLIAKRILGEFPGDEVVNNVRFGRKSSIGCPLSLAYLDEKLSNADAFTGTAETSAFFMNQVLPGDHILQKILASHDFVALKDQMNIGYLNLVSVPKTWESYRMITPLTLLGLFYSYGIGRIVTCLLAKHGLNIAKLQQKHAELVEEFSRSLKHATADVKGGSDNYTSALLNRVLPRPWYVALRKTFVRTIHLDGGERSLATESILPMGNGATFPIETLVFYCLIKAIGELTNTKGIYSVYGDDLIYPSRIHQYVAAVFPQLHIELNLSKTFVKYPFRESCGSDFYRGQDVRPYFLKGESQMLTRVRYEAFLYKVYNGLTRRWSELEIPSTLRWLLSELAMVSHTIYRVPPTYPDYSGIKVSSWTEIPLCYNNLSYSKIHLMHYDGSRWFTFRFLQETPQKRLVRSIEPYYWLSLQGISDDISEDEYKRASIAVFNTEVVASVRRTALEVVRNRIDVPQLAEKSSSLSWKRVKLAPLVYFRGKRKVVKKQYRYDGYVASRSGSTVSVAETEPGTISDWA
jgi:hypothetical protein